MLVEVHVVAGEVVNVAMADVAGATNMAGPTRRGVLEAMSGLVILIWAHLLGSFLGHHQGLLGCQGPVLANPRETESPRDSRTC